MRRLKQPHKLTVYRVRSRQPVDELLAPPCVLAFAIRGQPLFDEITSVISQTRAAGVFGVISLNGHKLSTAAAEDNVQTIAMGHLYELGSNIPAPKCLGLIRCRGAAFPVAIRTVSVGPGRCGMGNTRRRDNTGRHTPLFRKLCQGRQCISQRPSTVIALDIAVYTEHADTRFFTGGYRGNGARTVRHLCIGVVSFDQG